MVLLLVGGVLSFFSRYAGKLTLIGVMIFLATFCDRVCRTRHAGDIGSAIHYVCVEFLLR